MADAVMSKEWRRRRRHRLYRVGKQSKGAPSFVSLLNLKYEKDDETGDDDTMIDPRAVADQQREEAKRRQMLIEQLPKRIRIDLDAELGLKASQPALFFKQENDDTAEGGVYQQDLSQFMNEEGEDGSGRPGMIRSADTVPQFIPLSPSDEGWYEGTCPLRLPEDVDYLSKPQQWVRQNIEFFSATSRDLLAFSSSTRRGTVTPVLGQVGLRCRHCWAASFKADGAWAPGSMLFPPTMSTLSSLCSQKMMPHLEDCPNVSYAGKMHLLSLLQQPEDVESGPIQRAPRPGGVSPTLYYIISARRVGLVDVHNGIRFGRDLELEPLPFSTIRMLLESKNHGSNEADGELAEPRIAADAESEAVLAEAVAESMSAAEGTTPFGATVELCRVEDKTLVTDFLFLTLRQMAICHIRPSYFSSRGKKTKLMRLGLAGFCCRWCRGATDGDQQVDDWHADASSRSFASAAEGLSSAVSNTFTTHLQKCLKVPTKIKKALLAYKKLHHRQMAQLPYGSQTRLFREVWTRLRAADKTEDEIKAETPEDVVAAYDKLDSTEDKPDGAVNTHMEEDGSMQIDDEVLVYGRDPNLPGSDDPETKQVLLDAETDWDSSVNDSLILPRDRHLVSDYVFLVMRQLKMVASDAADTPRRPGLACIHCLGQDKGHVMATGRSFPSAPDNFASALNTSLYNHMQACLCVPDSVKRALANARKLHSIQCASIKFGSQRRYFNLLFDRLKSAYGENPDSQVGGVSDDFLKECSFVKLPALDKLRAIYICKSCRMVPIQFRVAGSTFVGMPRADLVRQHHSRCKKTLFDLNVFADLLDEILQVSSVGDSEGADLNFLVGSSFTELVRSCVGGEVRLLFTFTTELRDVLSKRRTEESTTGSVDAVSQQWNDLWNSFPNKVSVSEVEEAFRTFARTDGKNYCVSEVLKDNQVWIDLLVLMAPSLELVDDDVVNQMDV